MVLRTPALRFRIYLKVDDGLVQGYTSFLATMPSLFRKLSTVGEKTFRRRSSVYGSKPEDESSQSNGAQHESPQSPSSQTKAESPQTNGNGQTHKANGQTPKTNGQPLKTNGNHDGAGSNGHTRQATAVEPIPEVDESHEHQDGFAQMLKSLGKQASTLLPAQHPFSS